MPDVDVVVIGGGVSGLAAAAAIGEGGRSVCLLERHPRLGLETSSHNSGVIHAGIYYPPGSLKARLCVEGRERLYAFCRAHDIPHRRCGKLIVAATDDQVEALEPLAARARANGVTDVELVDAGVVRRREPHVRARAALWSPSTGIIEPESVVRALSARAVARGVIILPATRALGGQPRGDLIELRTEREVVTTRTVVNAAGLYADEVSRALGGESFQIYPVRGEYAELVPGRRDLVNGLVYPLPDPSSPTLGVHLTKTTWGTITLGPTARYQRSRDDLESNRLPLDEFVERARRLVPTITREQLRAGGAGIRPTLTPPGQPTADFLIRADRNVPRLIHAAGLDSPGLTACLAIGHHVAQLVERADDRPPRSAA